MDYVIWLCAGMVLVAPLLGYASRKGLRDNQRIFGIGLMVAAGLYVVFAAIHGNLFWLILEMLGVAAFFMFYWLAANFSINWLSLGWFLHPAWDGIIHVAGPGAQIAPFWYAVACVSFDWAIACYLGIRFFRDAARHSEHN